MLAKSDCDKVIPLFPEFIQPQDGAEKQDCELNAAKRWLAANGEKLAQLSILVGGDDLYSREPLCLQPHTVLEWMDSQYQLLRQKSPSRRRFFEDIRILTSYLYFDS
ncbi:MAG: hypothetical protein R3E08_06645 [Thiotrichaceae bacterium]